MMAFAAAGMLAVLRGRPGLGWALLTAAALTKWPAAVILLVLLVRRWVDLAGEAGPGRARRVASVVGRDLAIVAVTGLALSFVLIPDGFGWVRASSTPSIGLSLYSPVSAFANLIAILDGRPGAAMPGSGPLRIARVVCMALGALAVLGLLLTVRRRDPLTTSGIALLTIALLGPVLYPWYLVWGMVPLAMSRGVPRRGLLMVVGALGALLSIPHPELLLVGRPWLVEWFSREGPIVLAVLVACGIAVFVARRRRATRPTAAERTQAV
jgi:alpha-1,6-mannosyltransferase